MTKFPELKPCPVCGGESEITVPDHGRAYVAPTDPMHRARCDECGLQQGGWYSRAECIERWNTRIPAYKHGCIDTLSRVEGLVFTYMKLGDEDLRGFRREFMTLKREYE